MKQDKNLVSYSANVPSKHGLFGVGFLKKHRFMDKKWMPSDRVEQCRYMNDVLERHNRITELRHIAERVKQRQKVQGLKRECRDGRVKLKLALYGNRQRTKNILQKHKDMQRLYSTMPTHMVMENINQRTFVKRKERDRLLYRKGQLTKIYESRILELSRLQDQVRYQTQLVFAEEEEAKKCRMDLKNSETRIRAFETITRAYKQIIAALMQDNVYYDSVLNALQNDIDEQTAYIEQTIKIGLPAIGNLKKLQNEYKHFEHNTRKQLNERMSSLVTFRIQAAIISDDVRKLIRRDSDFEIFLRRYDRETKSMCDLKSKLADVEKVMKQVKGATLCAHSNEVYPRMKKQKEDNIKLEKSLRFRKKEKLTLKEKDKYADALKESLQHNLTQQDIERYKEIEDLKGKIVAEEKLQNEHENHIKSRGELFCLLRNSLHQMLDILRHVGELIPMPKKPYPDPDLKLPLLKFEAFETKTLPPIPVEENVQKLMKAIKERVRTLMTAYKEEKSANEIDEAVMNYHKVQLGSIYEADEHTDKAAEGFLSLLHIGVEDPNVPSRKQIKSMSAKIVEEMSKMEE